MQHVLSIAITQTAFTVPQCQTFEIVPEQPAELDSVFPRKCKDHNNHGSYLPLDEAPEVNTVICAQLPAICAWLHVICAWLLELSSTHSLHPKIRD